MNNDRHMHMVAHRCIIKSGTDSFHRTGAVSSRRGLTDRWGSLVPPGHNQGHTGRWYEPLAPVQCGMSSSSRSGSQAGLDRSHFGTPLRREILRKGWLMAPLGWCRCSWSRFGYSQAFPLSQQSRGSKRKQDKQRYTCCGHDAGTCSLWGRIHRSTDDWWTYCAITWPCDRVMDFICVGQSSNIISPA